MWPRIFSSPFFSSCAFAQQTKKTPPHVDDDFVHDQFGSFVAHLIRNFAPMTADLNSDGIEDLVLVARCKNALIDQDEKNYKVIDPMNSFYGYGQSKVTSSMGPADHD